MVVRCWCSSFEYPEHPSGSQVRLFTCYVTYSGAHLMYWMNNECLLYEEGNKKWSFFFSVVDALTVRCWFVVGVHRASQRQPFAFILCSFIYNGKHLMYWMKYIWFPFQKSYDSIILFPIGGSLAVRSCRSLLEYTEHPSGSQVS